MKKYGGARTNNRIIAIRYQDGLSRGDLALLTGYSKGYVDNWLLPVTSKYWRRAPENAVRLLEFEKKLRDFDKKLGNFEKKVRDWLIDSIDLAVTLERQGKYKGAAAVADLILKEL